LRAGMASAGGNARRDRRLAVRRTVHEEGARDRRGVGPADPDRARLPAGRAEPLEELPQPRARRRDRPERGRGRRRRLGALTPRERGSAAARPREGGLAMHAGQVILAPIVSEKSYAASVRGSYTFRV